MPEVYSHHDHPRRRVACAGRTSATALRGRVADGVDELASALRREARLWLPPEHPWAGDARAAFTWYLDGAGGSEAYVVDAILLAARGVVVRTTDGRFIEPVRRVRVALVNLLSKDGLRNALISLDADYLAYVRSAIDALLARHGYEADLQPYDDTRPFWLDARVDSLRRAGAPVRNVRAALTGLVVEIWGMDLDVRRDPTFWSG